MGCGDMGLAQVTFSYLNIIYTNFQPNLTAILQVIVPMWGGGGGELLVSIFLFTLSFLFNPTYG